MIFCENRCTTPDQVGGWHFRIMRVEIGRKALAVRFRIGMVRPALRRNTGLSGPRPRKVEEHDP
jgi:hypothetical protein